MGVCAVQTSLICSFSFSSTHFRSNDLYLVSLLISTFVCKTCYFALFFCLFKRFLAFNVFVLSKKLVDVRWFHERKGECSDWSQEGNRKRTENVERGARYGNTTDIFEVCYHFVVVVKYIFKTNIDNFQKKIPYNLQLT